MASTLTILVYLMYVHSCGNIKQHCTYIRCQFDLKWREQKSAEEKKCCLKKKPSFSSTQIIRLLHISFTLDHFWFVPFPRAAHLHLIFLDSMESYYYILHSCACLLSPTVYIVCLTQLRKIVAWQMGCSEMETLNASIHWSQKKKLWCHSFIIW